MRSSHSCPKEKEDAIVEALKLLSDDIVKTFRLSGYGLVSYEDERYVNMFFSMSKKCFMLLLYCDFIKYAWRNFHFIAAVF